MAGVYERTHKYQGDLAPHALKTFPNRAGLGNCSRINKTAETACRGWPLRCLPEKKGSETVRPVEVEFVHRVPGSPVRVRIIFGALEEIAAPRLSFDRAQGSYVLLEQPERQFKAQ